MFWTQKQNRRMLEKMVDLEGGSSEKTTTEHPDASTELDLVKLSLSNAKQQLKIKEKKMLALKSEVEMLKDLQSKLAEKEALLIESRRELERLRSSEDKIKELEQELDKRNDSETKLMDFMVVQTKQLEQTKIALEESKLVIANFPNSGKSKLANPRMFSNHEAEGLRSELQLTREKLCKAEEGERVAGVKNWALIDEVKKLREELRRLGEAEETGKRAIEDLAVLLKEVTTEANQAKEKLSLCQREIEKSRSEAAQAKFLMKSMENRYKSQVEEARKEAERERNASERLRIEVEDSNLAWSEKESMFVKCIKTAEEENVSAQRENRNLRAELSLARQAIDDLQYKEGSTASNEDLDEKEPLEMEVRDRNLEGKEREKSTEMDVWKENLVKDVKNSMDKESKEIKNLKDKDDVKILKEDSKDFKTAGNDSKYPKILKVKSFIDFRTSYENDPKDHKNTNNSDEKHFEDFKTAKERDLTDLNFLKDTSKNLKEEPKNHNILKTKSFAYSKIANDHKDSNVTKEKAFADFKNPKDFKDFNYVKENDLKDPKILKEDPKDHKFSKEDPKDHKFSKGDPKISKDQKDSKIPKDQKDPKINNLMKLSRNCSLNFKDTIHKPPIVNNNKDPKPPQINDNHDDDDNSIDDLLKGSIFDTVSPVSSSKSPTPRHKKSHSLTFEHDRSLEDFEHEEYEVEHENHENHHPSRSRRKPLFRRFGNMLSTKSFIRRSDTLK